MRRLHAARAAPLVACLIAFACALSCAEGGPLGEPPANLIGAGGEGGAGGNLPSGMGQSGSVGTAGVSDAGTGGSGGSSSGTGGEGGASGVSSSVGGSGGFAGTGDPTTVGSGGAATASDAGPSYDAGPDSAACESCVELKTALVHRYSFIGTGTQVTDSIGSANGAIVNASLSGSGTVVLAGAQSDQYVNLPNNIVHTLTNATFEAWITWQGGNAWQRIFDFGDEQTQTENSQGTGRSYLFLAATTGGTNGVIRSAYQKAGSPETIVNSVKSLPTGAMSHVAVVADDQNNKLLLYLNGSFEASTTWNDSLSLIHDINVWLGRSQYAADSELGATYHEFRIYGVALSAAQLALSAKAGPDPAFLN